MPGESGSWQVGEQGKMEGTTGMENKKGLKGLGCTEDNGMEHKARKRGKEHSFECLLCIRYSTYGI